MTAEAANPMNRNPEGRGGFADHPEHANPGGRPKNAESFSYWLNFFKSLPKGDFMQYEKEHPGMTMAALAAYARIGKMVHHLREFEVVANRTEGMPKQTIDVGMDDVTEIKVKIVRKKEDVDTTSHS